MKLKGPVARRGSCPLLKNSAVVQFPIILTRGAYNLYECGSVKTEIFPSLVYIYKKMKKISFKCYDFRKESF